MSSTLDMWYWASAQASLSFATYSCTTLVQFFNFLFFLHTESILPFHLSSSPSLPDFAMHGILIPHFAPALPSYPFFGPHAALIFALRYTPFHFAPLICVIFLGIAVYP